VSGDDRVVVSAVRARNRQELAEWEAGAVQGRLFRVTIIEPGGAVRQEYLEIADIAEAQPHQARERYIAYLTADEYRRNKLEADAWTAAFFWPLTPVGAQHAASLWAPTHAEFARLRDEGPRALPMEALAQIGALASRYRFFHWHLEFPGVFGQPAEGCGPSGGSGGFDVVLGNPPWERIKLQEKEFFADKGSAQAPAIAGARTAAERERLILALPQTDPILHMAYAAALRDSEATGHLLRDSGRFPLASGGGHQHLCRLCRAGPPSLVPSGAGGDHCASGDSDRLYLSRLYRGRDGERATGFLLRL
jgi:hypothetical protein